MIIVISGSSGLVGSALVEALEARGHLVRRLVRRDVQDGDREIRWDPAAGKIDAAELEGIDGVVHLAGEAVARRRWNERVKQEILDSRVRGTRLLAETLAALSSKPGVFCCASGVGYYGDRGDERLDERSPAGTGFLAGVCQQWEAATRAAHDAGIRVVNLRLGIVLSGRGGALMKMVTPFKLGVAGVIGNGRQYWPWITLTDVVALICFALESEALTGPVNAVAPQLVTNREFTKTLGRVLRRPTVLPMPAFAARLALGEMADEMLLASARVEPRALSGAGFSFQHPELEPALQHVLGK
jgi:uncharacterized protein (TIGR01777 family)